MRGIWAVLAIGTSVGVLHGCDSSESTTASDAGNEASDSATDGSASADSSAPQTITCGSQSCDPKTEVCCLFAGANECQLIDECEGAYLACSSSASCNAGEVCCGNFTAQGGHAKCAATCDTGRLCATNDECEAGETCQTFNPLLKLKVCRSPGDGGGCPPPPPDASVPPPCPDGG